jgi:hypothetical protein
MESDIEGFGRGVKFEKKVRNLRFAWEKAARPRCRPTDFLVDGIS